MKILQIEMVKNSTESFPYLLQSKFMLIHHIRLKNSRNPRISDFRNDSLCFLFISQEGSSKGSTEQNLFEELRTEPDQEQMNSSDLIGTLRSFDPWVQQNSI